MPQKWYQKASVQSAFVQGMFGLGAAIIAGIFLIYTVNRNDSTKATPEHSASGKRDSTVGIGVRLDNTFGKIQIISFFDAEIYIDSNRIDSIGNGQSKEYPCVAGAHYVEVKSPREVVRQTIDVEKGKVARVIAHSQRTISSEPLVDNRRIITNRVITSLPKVVRIEGDYFEPDSIQKMIANELVQNSNDAILMLETNSSDINVRNTIGIINEGRLNNNMKPGWVYWYRVEPYTQTFYFIAPGANEMHSIRLPFSNSIRLLSYRVFFNSSR